MYTGHMLNTLHSKGIADFNQSTPTQPSQGSLPVSGRMNNPSDGNIGKIDKIRDQIRAEAQFHLRTGLSLELTLS